LTARLHTQSSWGQDVDHAKGAWIHGVTRAPTAVAAAADDDSDHAHPSSPPTPQTPKQIKEIEDEMARTQKNKATSGHLGMLKAKLAKLRRDLLDPSKAPGGGGGGGGGDGFDVNKVGDARVGFVGFPSVGKSTLLTKLTGTHSEAAAYEFTTLTAVPGIVRYRGAKIQMLDLPGIIEGAKDGKGRGRQVISTARTCNLILIVLDCLKPLTHKKLIEHGELVVRCGAALIIRSWKSDNAAAHARSLSPPPPPKNNTPHQK
jgi:small GTP-binding protein